MIKEPKHKYRNDSTGPTIVAISTPPGIGGVGIVRLSGPESLSIAQKLFQRSKSTNTNKSFVRGLVRRSPLSALASASVDRDDGWNPSQLYYGYVRDPATHENIDDGYAVFFQSPHSFTGEDVVELQLHGNPFLLSSVVELCLKFRARLAQPGEFTKRAYLNGKMDLLQAEAVSELIHSQSIVEARQSRMRLDGRLSSHLEKLRDDVIDVLAEIEADVDFPEETIDFQSQKIILSRIQSMMEISKQLLATYSQNQKISSGFRIALVGTPNVGKSSLFNAILQNDRAIVNPVAGTTRDVLSEEIILDGYRVKFFDTAGLRNETTDEIEKEGISRSAQEISKADLVWWIGSTTHSHDERELEVLKNIEKEKCWLIWNKTDLQKPKQATFEKIFEKIFSVSAKTSEGISQLLAEVRKKVQTEGTQDFGGGISNDRQKEHLETTIHHFSKSAEMIQAHQPPELTAVEFRQSFHALNRLLGKEENMEAVYDRIFSKFCVGK